MESKISELQAIRANATTDAVFSFVSHSAGAYVKARKLLLQVWLLVILCSAIVGLTVCFSLGYIIKCCYDWGLISLSVKFRCRVGLDFMKLRVLTTWRRSELCLTIMG